MQRTLMILLMLPAALLADELQVLLPAAPLTERIDRLPTGRQWQLAGAVYLHERLAAQPGVVVADSAWGSTVLQRLTGPGRVTPADPLLPAVREHLPVDALVLLHADAKGLHVVVTSDDGAHEQTVPFRAGGLRRMAAFVAAHLDLPPAANERLTAAWVPDKEIGRAHV